MIAKKAITFLLFFLLVASVGFAQVQTQSGEQTREEVNVQISDEKIIEFIQVHQELDVLRNEYHNKMIEKINDSKITVDEYNQIAFAIQNSPELQEKFENFFEESVE